MKIKHVVSTYYGIYLLSVSDTFFYTEVYVLEEGDSIYFKSDIPLSFKNIGEGKLKLAWVITPPSW